MTTTYRWVILEHTGAPNDPQGIHYDLLLEDLTSCRTWRLNQIPNSNSIEVEAIRLSNHNLRWLNTKESILSRGRGYTGGGSGSSAGRSAGGTVGLSRQMGSGGYKALGGS